MKLTTKGMIRGGHGRGYFITDAGWQRVIGQAALAIRTHRPRRGATVCGLAAGYVAELVTNWRSLG
jgi:hypothetical protein